MEEIYEPIVERVTETLARVVFDPIRSGLTMDDWISLHARLCRESGDATFLDLNDMPRGIVLVNWNAAKNSAVDLDSAINAVVEAIQNSESIYDAALAVSAIQLDKSF